MMDPVTACALLVEALLRWIRRRFPARAEREAAALEALERREAAAAEALFRVDPGFSAELGYLPAPFPELPALLVTPKLIPPALSGSLASLLQSQQYQRQMMQAQQAQYLFASAMRAQQAPNTFQAQQMRAMQQSAPPGGLGQLGNAGGAIGMGTGLHGYAGIFGNGLTGGIVAQNAHIHLKPLSEAPKDPNVGAALGGLFNLYCAETIPCTCGAPETRDPTFHHGYCAIWQYKA